MMTQVKQPGLPWPAGRPAMRIALRLGGLLAGSFASFLAVIGPAAAIILGEEVRPSEPARQWTVLIENAEGRICSGALISPVIVLTAAHCTVNSARLTARLDHDAAGAAVPVIEVVRHPTFKPNQQPRLQTGTDLALLRLSRPAGAVREVLEVEPNDPPVGEPLSIFGFGFLHDGDRATSRVLRRAAVEHVGVYRHASGATAQFAQDPLTKAQAPGAGACGGDSGGPVLRGRQEKGSLVGIISWASGPSEVARCGGFTAFVPMAAHETWIRLNAELLLVRHLPRDADAPERPQPAQRQP